MRRSRHTSERTALAYPAIARAGVTGRGSLFFAAALLLASNPSMTSIQDRS